MGYYVRRDGLQSVLDWLDEQFSTEACSSIYIDKKTTGGRYKQVGDGFPLDNLAQLGAEEALSLIIESEVRTLGTYKLRTYKDPAVDPDFVPRSATFVAVRDATAGPSGRSGGEDGALAQAIGATAHQLQKSSEQANGRLDALHERLTASTDQILGTVTSAHQALRDAEGENSATVLQLTLALHDARTETRFANMEIERLLRESGGGVVAALIERTPPEVLAQIVAGLAGSIMALGNAGAARLMQEVQAPAPAPAPQQPRVASPPATEPQPPTDPPSAA